MATQRSYKHTKCGGVTKMSPTFAEIFANNPQSFPHLPCVPCGGIRFRVSEFTWHPDGEPVANGNG